MSYRSNPLLVNPKSENVKVKAQTHLDNANSLHDSVNKQLLNYTQDGGKRKKRHSKRRYSKRRHSKRRNSKKR